MSSLGVDTSPADRQGRFGVASRTAIGGLLGGLPGLLLAVVPVLLADFDVITSDQSQIGFTGIPLIFLGILFGSFAGAAGSSCTGSMMLGSVVGLAGGLSAGVVLSMVAPGLWLVIAPAGQLVGAVVAVRVCRARVHAE